MTNIDNSDQLELAIVAQDGDGVITTDSNSLNVPSKQEIQRVAQKYSKTQHNLSVFYSSFIKAFM